MKMMACHWILMEIMALTVLQAWATFDYLPRSVKSSDPFTFISDGDDNTCMAIPNTRPTRMQMSVPEPWIEDVAWFSIRGHHVGCHTSTSAPEKLYLMPLTSPLSLTDQSAGGVRKICTLEESTLDGTMENCTYSCMCPAKCSHVYLVHLALPKPEWKLCAWEFKALQSFPKDNWQCQSSSQLSTDSSCHKAFDDSTATDFKSNLEGSGAWIRIDLPSVIGVVAVELSFRCSAEDQFSTPQFVFSDGTVRNETHQCSAGCSSQAYRFGSPIATSMLRINMLDECIPGHTDIALGLKEVDIYA